MPQTRYIRVSEINTYLFCKRASHLSQRGSESMLEPERAEGVVHHQAHGDRVRSARAAARIPRGRAVAGVVLLIVSGWLALR
jgi:CRISPR/Cas system-associated exonuclease Cas4 (RecB family)